MQYLLKIKHPGLSVDKLNQIGDSFNQLLPNSFTHKISPKRRVVSIDVACQEGVHAALPNIKRLEPAIVNLAKMGCSFSLWFFVDAPCEEEGAVSEDYLFDCDDMRLLTSLNIDLVLSVSSPPDPA